MRQVLLTTTATDDDGDDYLPGHGDRTYDVERYELDLSYKLEGNQLSGVATISARARTNLDHLTLDLHGLRATKVAIVGIGVTRFTVRRGKLVVRARSTIAAGSSFTVVVSYHGRPSTVPDAAGAAGWEELDDGVIVAGQPGGGPSWFPCNDRPDNKAPYRLVVTAPNAYYVVSNGTLSGTRRSASSVTWTYDQREPMATYQATVQIGRYVRSELGAEPIPMVAVHPPALKGRLGSAFGRMAEMVATFERLFGPYPFPEYTVVVTDDELEIPLEAQGMAVFGSNFLDSDWSSVRLVAHELSHQWFGNSVTATRWREIWLHEGFACYAEWLWSQESGGWTTHERAVEHWKRLAALPQDLRVGDPGPTKMFDDRVYKRGALTLHAVRLTIGEGPFFDVLRAWTTTYRHSNATTEMFIELAERRSGHQVGDLVKTWLYDEALPDLPAPR